MASFVKTSCRTNCYGNLLSKIPLRNPRVWATALKRLDVEKVLQRHTGIFQCVYKVVVVLDSLLADGFVGAIRHQACPGYREPVVLSLRVAIIFLMEVS